MAEGVGKRRVGRKDYGRNGPPLDSSASARHWWRNEISVLSPPGVVPEKFLKFYRF